MMIKSEHKLRTLEETNRLRGLTLIRSPVMCQRENEIFRAEMENKLSAGWGR